MVFLTCILLVALLKQEALMSTLKRNILGYSQFVFWFFFPQRDVNWRKETFQNRDHNQPVEPAAKTKEKSFTKMKSLAEFQDWHISMYSSQLTSDCHFLKSKYLTPLMFDKHSELLNQIEIFP